MRVGWCKTPDFCFTNLTLRQINFESCQLLLLISLRQNRWRSNHFGQLFVCQSFLRVCLLTNTVDIWLRCHLIDKPCQVTLPSWSHISFFFFLSYILKHLLVLFSKVKYLWATEWFFWRISTFKRHLMLFAEPFFVRIARYLWLTLVVFELWKWRHAFAFWVTQHLQVCFIVFLNVFEIFVIIFSSFI